MHVRSTNLQQGSQKYTMGKGQGKLHSQVQRNETGPLYYAIHKNQTQLKNGLMQNHRTPKRKQEVSQRGFTLTLILVMIFLDQTPKARATETKISKWDYIRGTCLHTAKQTVDLSPPPEQQRVSASDTFDEGLTPKIYKEVIHLNTKQMNKQTKTTS